MYDLSRNCTVDSKRWHILASIEIINAVNKYSLLILTRIARPLLFVSAVYITNQSCILTKSALRHSSLIRKSWWEIQKKSSDAYSVGYCGDRVPYYSKPITVNCNFHADSLFPLSLAHARFSCYPWKSATCFQCIVKRHASSADITDILISKSCLIF